MNKNILNIDYPIIDCHTHVFPEKIARKAVDSIGEFYGIEMTRTGSMTELYDEAQSFGVSKMLITATATKNEQVRSINDFLYESQNKYEGFFAFGTLFPEMSRYEMETEIERLIQMGFYGVKLHPDFQCTPADSDGMKLIARLASGKLPVLIHAGDSRYDYSNPDRIRNLIESAPPEFTLIAAHLGGYSVWDEAALKLTGFDNLYVDTCSSLYFLEPERVIELINIYGEDKVLFGTDYPMWNYADEFEMITRLKLSPVIQRKILYENANSLFFSGKVI